MVMSGQSPPNFVGLLPIIEMNDNSSPAIQHHSSKQLRIICRGWSNVTTLPGQAQAFKAVNKYMYSSAQSVCSSARRHLADGPLLQGPMGGGLFVVSAEV